MRRVALVMVVPLIVGAATLVSLNLTASGVSAVSAIGIGSGHAPLATTRLASLSTAAPVKKVVWTADIGATYRVMREDGPHSPNRTDLTGAFTGADTGTMFSYQGQTYTVFNDAHEGPIVPLGTNYFASPLTDWRSQTMAISSDNNPADGITYDSLITDTQTTPRH